DGAAVFLRRLRDADQPPFQVLEEDVARPAWVEPPRELRRVHGFAVPPVGGQAEAPRPGQGLAVRPDHRARELPARVERHVALHRSDPPGRVDPGDGDATAPGQVPVDIRIRGELLEPVLVLPFGDLQVRVPLVYGDHAGP